jgi:hypothetical protein
MARQLIYPNADNPAVDAQPSINGEGNNRDDAIEPTGHSEPALAAEPDRTSYASSCR